MRTVLAWFLGALVLVGGGSMGARAASGEMGTGVPAAVGSYSAATGVQTIIWSLSNPSIPFPAGCSSITLSPATMGMDAYKIAVAAAMMATATNRPLRFYAHASRDSGCGVDYVQFGQ
jgi:hypothetical protein